MKSWDDIKKDVASNGGVSTFEAWVLRDAQGAGRLTERINGNILDSLRSRGLGAVPGEAYLMPTNQMELVRVYDATSVIGKVIEAALTPGRSQDEFLVETIDTGSAVILKQVRDLVAID